MQQLPSEVLSSIISNLKLHDRLQCIRVCKLWHSVITSSVLFEYLHLENEEKLNQAITYFESRQNLSNQVKTLQIDECGSNINTLPIIFPHVKCAQIKRGSQPLTTPSGHYSNWSSNFVTVKDHTQFQFFAAVLESPCLNLQYLDLMLGSGIQEDFFKNLKHAPALKHLLIRSVKRIHLQEMEMLHNNTSHLQTLEINCLMILSDKQQVIKPIIIISERLKTFRIRISISSRPLIEWINYFEKKYHNLEEIVIKHLDYRDRVFQPHIEQMLSSMPFLKFMDINIAPLTGKMLTKKLDTIGINAMNDLKDLELVMSSPSTQDIKTLNITGNDYDLIKNQKVWKDMFLKTSDTFAYLVNLSITEVDTDSTLLMNLINCLSNLKSLTFDRVSIRRSQPVLQPTTTAIQHLSITMIAWWNADVPETYNSTLQFLLDACPSLQTFKLDQGEAYTVPLGGVYLDFRNHLRLKKISVTAMCEQYFTFSQIPEKRNKRWKTFHTQVKEQQISEYVNYYIDLAWNGYVDLDLQSDLE